MGRAWTLHILGQIVHHPVRVNKRRSCLLASTVYGPKGRGWSSITYRQHHGSFEDLVQEFCRLVFLCNSVVLLGRVQQLHVRDQHAMRDNKQSAISNQQHEGTHEADSLPQAAGKKLHQHCEGCMAYTCVRFVTWACTVQEDVHARTGDALARWCLQTI